MGESQIMAKSASHSMKQRPGRPIQTVPAMTATAKIKSSLRSSAEQQRSSLPYSAEDKSSVRSGSKTETSYEDDFNSTISKSHLSASHKQNKANSGK